MKKIIFMLILNLTFLFSSTITDRALYRKNYSDEPKTALVIGNNNYSNFAKLKNAENDAKDISDALKQLGFDVIYLNNTSLREMKNKVREFTRKLKKGGVGFFYYAGHGVEVDSNNYLIPIDAYIPEKNEVEYESLAVNMIIDKMEDSENRLNILVLDACRNDPFSRGGGGLAQINNAKGMYIAYSTAPGKVASDGKGRNGLFTKHLIKNILKNNLSLNEVFDNTRESVYLESKKIQLPWTSSSVIGSFYFKNNIEDKFKNKNNENSKKFEENLLWSIVEKNNSIEYYKQYLKKYPDGIHSKMAIERIKIINNFENELSKKNKKLRVILLPNKINVDNRSSNYVSNDICSPWSNGFIKNDKRFEITLDYCKKQEKDFYTFKDNEDFWINTAWYLPPSLNVEKIKKTFNNEDGDFAFGFNISTSGYLISYSARIYMIDLKTYKQYIKNLSIPSNPSRSDNGYYKSIVKNELIKLLDTYKN